MWVISISCHHAAAVQVLDGLHIWGPDFLAARLKWRERQPITILELRAYR